MHLFLCGESGAGKSYAIERALESLSIEPGGFTTRKREAADGGVRIEICYKGGGGVVAEGACGRGFKTYPAQFDAAAAALEHVGAGEVLRMDELGFLERDAARFQSAVLEALRSPCRTIGVCKDEEIPFMQALRRVPGVRVLHATKDTREEMFRKVREFLRPRPLCEALGVGIGMTAVIGGGGKTSLLEALGREMAAEDRVALTTTTHVGLPKALPLAHTKKELEAALEKGGPVWIAVPVPEETDPLKLGPPAESMEALLECCDVLLVEADGSKGLPCKVHAAHEPAVPPGARVIAVLGADAFGRPIGEVVHRPEICAARLGVGQSEILSAELAARVLGYADTVLVNKVETAARLQAARDFARARPHKRTVLASLRSARPVIEIWEGELCVW